MNFRRQPSPARVFVLATVIAGHIVVFTLLFRPYLSSHIVKPDLPGTIVVRFFDFLPEEPMPPTRHPIRFPEKRTSAPRAPSLTDQVIETQPAAPLIDWYGQAAEVAQEANRSDLLPRQPGCDSSRKPGSITPKCKQRPDYRPQPPEKRAGFFKGLPYVRLGKRCIVGLGFAGCAIGPLPKSSGGRELLEDMRDPTRPQSSIPELPEQLQEGDLDSRAGPRKP